MHNNQPNRSKNINSLSPVSELELYDGEMYDNPNNIDSNEHLKPQPQQGVEFKPATLPPPPQTPYPGDIDADISTKFINLTTSITDPKTTNRAYNQVVNRGNLSSNEGNNGILSLHTGDVDTLKRLNNLEAEADLDADNNSSHERQVKKRRRSPLCVCVSLVFLIAVTVGMGLLVTKFSGAGLFNTEKSPVVTGPTTSPTLFPTPIPTVSPTLEPTKQPTVSPTNSPTTSSPTKSPTNSPTTELSYLTSLCSNTKRVKRTSICVDSNNWIRCERDGTIKANELGQLYRTCETGDVCGCTSFVRLSTGDPCVLDEDKDNSTMTCVPDS